MLLDRPRPRAPCLRSCHGSVVDGRPRPRRCRFGPNFLKNPHRFAELRPMQHGLRRRSDARDSGRLATPERCLGGRDRLRVARRPALRLRRGMWPSRCRSRREGRPSTRSLIAPDAVQSQRLLTHCGVPYRAVARCRASTRRSRRAGSSSVAEWSSSGDVTFERNPHYYATDRPYFPTVEYVSVPDDNELARLFEAGEIRYRQLRVDLRRGGAVPGRQPGRDAAQSGLPPLAQRDAGTVRRL